MANEKVDKLIDELTGRPGHCAAKIPIRAENMDLRDFFAGMVIGTIFRDHEEGCLADRHGRDPEWRVEISLEAYKIADAMLSARHSPTPGADRGGA